MLDSSSSSSSTRNLLAPVYTAGLLLDGPAIGCWPHRPLHAATAAAQVGVASPTELQQIDESKEWVLATLSAERDKVLAKGGQPADPLLDAFMVSRAK